MWEFFVQIVSQLTQFIFHAEVLISSSSETLENDLDFEGHDKDTAWGVVFGKLGVEGHDKDILCYRNSMIRYREKIMQLVYILYKYPSHIELHVVILGQNSADGVCFVHCQLSLIIYDDMLQVVNSSNW